MTFDDDARIDSSHVKRRRGGRGVAIGGGGAAGVAIVVFLIAQFTGVDLSGIVGGTTGGSGAGTGTDETITNCDTGSDANGNIDCLLGGAADSLDTYWSSQVQNYRSTQVILFEDQTDTGCGGATSAVGPFYCPADEQIYIDTGFYDDLRTNYGSSGGTLAQMYVLAHEWGHHVQNVLGTSQNLDLQDTGPKSDSVRLELQADCYAGAWVGAAPTIKDENGTSFLDPVTDAQIADALSAAAAVGDDRIQASSGGGVDRESWTHGSSESRQKWFTAGRQGGPSACDTFSVSAP
jgi:predicted metalloprotease